MYQAQGNKQQHDDSLQHWSKSGPCGQCTIAPTHYQANSVLLRLFSGFVPSRKKPKSAGASSPTEGNSVAKNYRFGFKTLPNWTRLAWRHYVFIMKTLVSLSCNNCLHCITSDKEALWFPCSVPRDLCEAFCARVLARVTPHNLVDENRDRCKNTLQCKRGKRAKREGETKVRKWEAKSISRNQEQIRSSTKHKLVFTHFLLRWCCPWLSPTVQSTKCFTQTLLRQFSFITSERCQLLLSRWNRSIFQNCICHFCASGLHL